MALNWKLGRFIDGAITREESLPIKNKSTTVSIDINGEDTAELSIVRSGLTKAENNNWQETFNPIMTLVVCEDNEKEWNEPGAVVFAGFINKITDKITPGVINAQVTSITEYLKARIVADTWSRVTDPTSEVTFSGDSWSSVMTKVIEACFSRVGIPAGKPMPPLVLGNRPTPADGAVKKTVSVIDAKTYYDVVKDIKNEDSGIGLEYRFVPRWTDASKTNIVWDLIIGTNAVPHIGEDQRITLTLDDNDTKMSAYSATIDSTEIFSKMYIQSKKGDEEAKNGADFTPGSVEAGKFPVLVERFFNAGVELTEEELQAQLTARLKYAAENDFETSFTIEENTDPSVWLSRLGNIIEIDGVDNTISAGHDAVVRCVGIDFTPGQGTISVDVMQLAPSYPRLPKDRVKNLLPNTRDSGLGGIGTGGGGGGGTPVMPSIPSTPKPNAGTEGVFTPDDLWGDIGHNPWDTFPPAPIQTLGFRNYKETSQIIEDWEGYSPWHPWSTCGGIGNRLYTLDRPTQVYQTIYDENGNKSFGGNGEVNILNGTVEGGIKPFYIKKTYMADGMFGPIEAAGVIPVDLIQKVLPKWQISTRSKTDISFTKSIVISNVIIDDRFTIIIGASHSINYNDNNISNLPLAEYGQSKAIVFSSSINLETGQVTGDWIEEGPWKAEDNYYMFPLTPKIATSGKAAYISGWSTVFDDEEYSVKNIAGVPKQYRGDQSLEDFTKELSDSKLSTTIASYSMMPLGFLVRTPNGSYNFWQNYYAQSPEFSIKLHDLDYDFANNKLRGSYNGQSYTIATYGKDVFISYGIRSQQNINRKRMSVSGEILSDPFKQVLNEVDPYSTLGFMTPIASNIVDIGVIGNYGVGNLLVTYSKTETNNVGNTKIIPTDQTAEYNNFLFQLDTSLQESYDHISTFPFPVIEASEDTAGMYVEYPWLAERIFQYDNTLYFFQLQMNDEGTKRNKLVCHSMEAYDPSI